MQLQVKLQKKAEITYLEGSNQQTRLTANMFRWFEVRKKVVLMFSRPHESMKTKCYLFRGYKQRYRVFSVYLECKLEQESYRVSIFKKKGTIDVLKEKQMHER